MVILFVAFVKERECVQKLRRMKNGIVSTFPFLPASNAENPHLSSPITTKGFINYVFFRNRAVRNPAGTRLDSLVW